MAEERLKYLLERYSMSNCTLEELEELNEWYHSLNFKDESFDAWVSDKDKFYADFQGRLNAGTRVRTLKRITVYAAAAAIVIFVSVGLWFLRTDKPAESLKVENKIEDIEPGGNKALLTLANGVKISLGDAANGEIAKQTGIQITKTKDGQLIYKILDPSPGSPGTDEISYNTIETPRGGQYQIILPDKSRVWLNAASSLRYPTVFKGKERNVELKGEAYFEIAHNKDLPFKVKTNDQIVQVLGTHFNINSYSDEPAIKTTLVIGSVKVFSLSSGASELLAPGEQATLTKNGQMNKIANVNMEEVIGWKNNLFHFDNSNIEVVLRQLSRWYDVEVEYEGKIPQVRLSGEIYRSTNATKVLDILSYFNVKYRIEGSQGDRGKKIIISQ